MTSERRRAWIDELEASLRGTSRASNRLLAELDAHVEDAICEEMAAGLDFGAAERAALARVGSVLDVARPWNDHASARRLAVRLRMLAMGVAAAAVLAPVGLAQRSDPAHKVPSTPKPAPKVVRRGPGAVPGRAS